MLSKTILSHLNVTFVVKYQIKKNFKSHIESVHERKKPYECDICGKVLDEEQNFKSHIESVHERKQPYECDIFGEVFNEE